MLQFYIILLFMTLSQTASAEYRVYLLKIFKKADSNSSTSIEKESNNENPQQQEMETNFRLVKSTLDHLQYPSYYSLKNDEQISLVTSWRCRGRTDQFKEYCPNPKDSPINPTDANPPQKTSLNKV